MNSILQNLLTGCFDMNALTKNQKITINSDLDEARDMCDTLADALMLMQSKCTDSELHKIASAALNAYDSFK